MIPGSESGFGTGFVTWVRVGIRNRGWNCSQVLRQGVGSDFRDGLRQGVELGFTTGARVEICDGSRVQDWVSCRGLRSGFVVEFRDWGRIGGPGQVLVRGAMVGFQDGVVSFRVGFRDCGHGRVSGW